MTSLVFLLYAAIHLALFGWSLGLLLRHREPATVPLLVVTFGLVYDNSLLALGNFIEIGEHLERLSVPRFFMHAFGTPLLMLTALGLVRRTGLRWSRTRLLAAAIAVLTILTIAVGVEADLVRLDLAPKRSGDLLSYGNAATAGPPIAPLVTIAVLLAAGLAVWRAGGGPWLLLGSLLQFAAAAIGDAIAIAGNLGEVALLAGLVVTDASLRPPDHSPLARSST